ncbi:MMPL family transporter [Nocardioides sp. TRM66260-LWL]|uniref:MMPL family transporter n=1 Tax=Nocardioides sp. TRM66260-LWL TaxID=2874478 RepID=UPI001CC38A4D|nr:MMPL family transporter [Nocardioides sp. TRM66260-LWL]MBZ5735496.1 MMPL family transporter [Nocardioides sp. TRM66260-LWL]
MATFLYRLGRGAYRRWPLALASWLVAIIAVGVVAAGFGKPMTDAFTIPGIPSEKAADLQSELYPDAVDAFDQAGVTVVVRAPEGQTLRDAGPEQAVTDLVGRLKALPQLSREGRQAIVGPVQAADGQRQQALKGARQAGTPQATVERNLEATSPLSQDARTGLITFAWDVATPADVQADTIDALDAALASARTDGLTAEANGTGSKVQAAVDGTSELIGIGVALVVLLLTFGSLVAAGLPILIALVGVGLGVSGITASTLLFDIGSTTPILATMIGLAVGIDYTLFILARYRAELERTDDREDAIGVAVGTAGSAVVFAGLTVLIALAALSIVRIPFLTAMGLAAAGTVLVAVLVALTLLPAILGILKSKAFAGRVRRTGGTRDADGRLLNNGVRWARLVGRAPVAAVLLVVVALGALAIPAKGLHLAFPSDSTASSDTTQRKASDLITDAFGPGRDGPLLVVVDARALPEADRQAAFGQVVEWAAGQQGVANAQLTLPSPDGAGQQVLITPSSGPDDTATEQLLRDLRDGQAGIEQRTGTTIGVTGLTAITTDVSDRLAGALPIYLAVVIGLAFVLLMVVFRSVLVPLTATLGFLLSVLATLGATVAVFQEGAFGLMEGQPIVSFMPIFLIGVVFGLAMDYQVFLVTRIREAHVHGMSTREAVVDGFRNSARVVAAAATIMTAVFSAFMLQSDPIVKSMGFALAVAVVFDAFVVRMVLIPALLQLLGERAWWLPRWLDRLLPNVDVEGESLQRPGASTDRELDEELRTLGGDAEHAGSR